MTVFTVLKVHDVFNKVQEWRRNLLSLVANNIIQKILDYIFFINVVSRTSRIYEANYIIPRHGFVFYHSIQRQPHSLDKYMKIIVFDVLIRLHEINHASNIGLV